MPPPGSHTTRHACSAPGGFLRRLIRFPPFRYACKSLFFEPLDAHGLMSLRADAHAPPALAAKGEDPGLVGLHPMCFQELEDGVPTFQLLEFDNPNFTSEPLIQFKHQAAGAAVSIIRHPSVDVAVEPSDLLVKGAGAVPSSQFAYAILKTGDTLGRYTQGPVVETGGSRGTIARSRWPPPISPRSRAA